MEFFTVLWAEVVAAKSQWLALLVACAVLVARFASPRFPRLKALTFFTAMHVVLLLVTAALENAGSTLAQEFRVPAWVFAGVSFVGAASVLVFDFLLVRLKFEVPRIVHDLLVAILSVATGVSIASRAGINLSGLIATSAVFTAILGFSLQDVIGNIASGLALQTDTSIELGDWIKVNDVTGRVVEIRWRYTAIETRNWETVLVPNIVLLRSQVTVLGRRGGAPQYLRRWVYFNVDWRHQPSDVIDVVQNAVRNAGLERVATEPKANCVLMEMGDSYGKYAVRYWLTDIAVDDPTDSAVRTVIFFALHRADMKLAIPAQSVFVTEESSDRSAIKTEKQLERRRRLIGQLELFKSLSSDERDQLAVQLKYAPFARGEVMTRQGTEAHWLYIIEEGTASVRVSDGALQKEVNRLGNVSFFGEMSLLTGEPRSATVVAETDVECFRLDKVAFQRVLENRPDLAKEVATVLARRQMELQAVKEGLDAETAKRRQADSESYFIKKIRSFFALKD